MILNRRSWLYQILYRLPLWLPYSLTDIRVGNDCNSFARWAWRCPR